MRLIMRHEIEKVLESMKNDYKRWHMASRTVHQNAEEFARAIDIRESMIEEYIIDFGMTKYIKGKKAYFYSRIMPFFDKNIKKYAHLVDMNQCLKQFNSV